MATLSFTKEPARAEKTIIGFDNKEINYIFAGGIYLIALQMLILNAIGLQIRPS